ncbi:MAG TPA: hypothetical protein VFO93_18210 [Hymenobacter sp.]|uniref:hypothetical protein n=1 Tax=Hymenobacter sp. TaxID=1898978 RepID=UPI002D7E1A2E|nr:hypothetical protein [Hymenobacter sp.]HET9505483.1 hypothetical protein [Hymenobacter sp.]
MILRFRYSKLSQAAAALTILIGASLLNGCRNETVTPNPADDYYPLTVGTYRAYAVSDTTWSKGVATASNYQLREAITQQYADAAGQPAYRILRARRANSAAAWVDDSVYVVQPLPQSITLTRDNVRSIELIYPIVAGKTWRKYSFTTTRADSVRVFDPSVGKPFTTPGPAPKTYDRTATVRDVQPVALNDGLYRQAGYLQVFAQNAGAVARRRYYYETFITLPNQAQQLTPGVIQQGRSRLEVLIDSGKL